MLVFWVVLFVVVAVVVVVVVHEQIIGSPLLKCSIVSPDFMLFPSFFTQTHNVAAISAAEAAAAHCHRS